jgi:protein-L-isoaspartate(D-aspartate) O-methyltransferase
LENHHRNGKYPQPDSCVDGAIGHVLPDLAERARANLARAGIHNAMVVVGDGSHGLLAYAPYQAVIVAAAAPSVPPALIDQLDDDGRLVQPIGHGGDGMLIAFRKRDRQLPEERTAACFLPLLGRSEAL